MTIRVNESGFTFPVSNPFYGQRGFTATRKSASEAQIPRLLAREGTRIPANVHVKNGSHAENIKKGEMVRENVEIRPNGKGFSQSSRNPVQRNQKGQVSLRSKLTRP